MRTPWTKSEARTAETGDRYGGPEGALAAKDRPAVSSAPAYGSAVGQSCGKAANGSGRLDGPTQWLSARGASRVDGCGGSNPGSAPRAEAMQRLGRVRCGGDPADVDRPEGAGHSVCSNHRTDTGTPRSFGWPPPCAACSAAERVVSARGSLGAGGVGQLRHRGRACDPGRAGRSGAQWHQSARRAVRLVAAGPDDRASDRSVPAAALATSRSAHICAIRQRHHFSGCPSVGGQLRPGNSSVPEPGDRAGFCPAKRNRIPGDD